MDSENGWVLTLFAESGRCSVGLIDGNTVWFALNPEVPLESAGAEESVAFSWTEGPKVEIINQVELIKSALVKFYDSGSPSKSVRWRDRLNHKNII